MKRTTLIRMLRELEGAKFKPTTFRKLMKRFLDNDKATFKVKYETYMHSRLWLEVRGRVIVKRGETCERCGKNGPVHVHHLSYANFGHEPDDDLKLLCKDCHELMHRFRNVA